MGASWTVLRVVLVSVLSLACIAVPKLALPAVFLTLICFLSLPKQISKRQRTALLGLVAVSALCASVGTLRFVVTEAVPGIIQGGKDAAAKAAISRLREILFAEDAMRTHAFLDADRDGIGSAGLIGELAAARPPRSGEPFTPILNELYRHLVDTKSGPAAQVSGYLYLVCLPSKSGSLTARAEDGVDEEVAERRFVAYAWPAAPSGRIESAFFIDEHERILVSRNIEGTDPHYVGADFPPPCEAALHDHSEWQPWMSKKPRATLPGDVSAAH